MLINKNTNKNYNPRQLKLPLDLERIIDISDPVYSFSEIVDCIDFTSYFAVKERKTGRPRYNLTIMLKIILGLTATPKDEIDKNTYEIFELDNGVPTYVYDLAQAVNDKYLVDDVSIESKLKFIEQGIVYDDLSEEDKATYEATFEDENGELPE